MNPAAEKYSSYKKERTSYKVRRRKNVRRKSKYFTGKNRLIF